MHIPLFNGELIHRQEIQKDERKGVQKSKISGVLKSYLKARGGAKYEI